MKEAECSLETGSAKPQAWSRQRRLFLASDDALAFREAQSQYPRNEFIGRQRKGSQVDDRRSTEGVFAITLDLHLLCSADFLIGTGSSYICRLACELASLKSQSQGDAAFQWHTVDAMYECSFSRKRWWRAIADFKQE
ncbi:unnamed protein product, partial [Dibothriocephalus latus]